ncbi:MAG TPA: hypothetical protein VF916_02965, partial [Ktedonobacterales bacterium]
VTHGQLSIGSLVSYMGLMSILRFPSNISIFSFSLVQLGIAGAGRILILDDSTSAIDSATEDEIQHAIRRVLEGRTTLLITHRLSQIRQADKILVLKRGELLDQGTHDELLVRSETYRRIFAHYDPALAASHGAHAQVAE